MSHVLQKKHAHHDAASHGKVAPKPAFSAYQNSIDNAAQASAEGITSLRQ